MRLGAWTVILGLGLAAGAFWLGGAASSDLAAPAVAAEGTAAAKPAEKPAGPPPLKVDRSAPLRLDEPPAAKPAKKPTGPVADNSACFVCHTNYDGEEMVTQHALGNVGCVKCHGESHPHRNDEDNITPPDIMYPAEKIDKSCLECHDTHDASAKDVIARWQKKCPSKSDPTLLLCTDCHGEHRLKQRQVVWDKRTRKLVPNKNGRPISPTKAPEALEPAATMQ